MGKKKQKTVKSPVVGAVWLGTAHLHYKWRRYALTVCGIKIIDTEEALARGGERHRDGYAVCSTCTEGLLAITLELSEQGIVLRPDSRAPGTLTVDQERMGIRRQEVRGPEGPSRRKDERARDNRGRILGASDAAISPASPTSRAELLARASGSTKDVHDDGRND